jgi:hypothetical protein
MSKTEEDALREYAKKRLKNQQEFKRFLFIWAFVSALLTVIWFWVSPETFYWPIFAIGGMGIGAYFQWLDAYGPGLRKVITEADIDAEVERLRRKG